MTFGLSHIPDNISTRMEQTVEDLLLVISEVKNNANEAERAFTKLYRRYAQFLKNAVASHAKFKGIHDEELVDSILNNVFYEVYADPLKFSFDEKNHKSEDTAFKAWLSQIARYEFSDLLKASITYSSIQGHTIDEGMIERFAEISVGEEFLSDNRKALDKALSTLSDRNRHILITCFDYFEDGKNTPSDVLDSLCEYWGTTKPNIRQAKKRSLEKVKNYLEKTVKLRAIK